MVEITTTATTTTTTTTTVSYSSSNSTAIGAPGEFGAIDVAVLAVYFVAVVATGIYAMCSSKRDTTAGYFLAGRFITFIPIGASLFASNIGSQHFIGLAGSGAAAGIGVGAFELNALILLQVLGWIFLPVYLSSGVFTLPEYIQKRFGGRRILIYLSVLSLAIYILTKISVNLYSGSLFIKTALDWPTASSIALLIGLTAFCTITGGLAAVIYTDTIQAFLMCAGGLTLMMFAFVEVGGFTSLYQRYMEVRPDSMLENSTCGEPRKDALLLMRDPIHSDMPWPAFIFGQTTASIWYWCADQVIVQRALAAKSLSHAQGGTLFAGYLKILPLFMIIMPGMISRVLYTDEIACANPDRCEQICGNRAGCSNLAYPKLIMNLMPAGLRGLMVAVMLAALITDLTSIFNSASSLFTMDVYPLFRKKTSNREQMIIGRLFVVVMIVISILWIPVVQSNQGGQLYIYIQAISAYLSPPIAAIFMTAIIWPRANEQGAFWSLMAGLVTGGVRMVMDFAYKEPECGEIDERPAIIRNVHYMYFALILFVQTVVVMVAISLLTRPLEDWRTIRTVFWRRFDETVRVDEIAKAEEVSLVQADVIRKRKQLEVDAERNNAVPQVSREESSGEMVAVISNSDVIYGKVTKNVVDLEHGVVVVEKKDINQSSSFWDRLGASSALDDNGRRKSPSQLVLSRLKALTTWFCGFSLTGEPKSLVEACDVSMKGGCLSDNSKPFVTSKEDLAREHVRTLVESIRQSARSRLILNLNLVLIIAIALFLLVFFSMPPEMYGLAVKSS